MSDFRNLVSDEIITKCEHCSGEVMYKGSGRYVCQDCGAEFLNDFGKVKKYIREHGPSNALTIAEGTGVSRQKIRQYLREGRVEVVEDAAAGVSFCLSCGLPIRTGQYCSRCLERMEKAAAKGEKGVYNALSEEVKSRQKGQRRFDNRTK